MATDILGMSDEEFLNTPPPEEEPEITENTDDTGLEEASETESTVEEGDQEDSEEGSEDEQETDKTGEETDGLQEQEEDSEEVEEDNASETAQEDSGEVLDTNPDIDYKSEYERLLQPFKANGKEIRLESVDDAISLMQMGANYNKKMAALKPNLKLLKMLENNQLLDESKLSFLIDLDKKNPEAIQKLLKDSGVDPLDINTDEEVNYKPNTYNVSDREVEIDGILEEIRDTESFNTTIDILGNKWDDSSKQVITENPQLIKVINDHVASGIYNQISSVVERERMLGRLTGLSDIEAYKQVGDALNAQGAFNSQPQSKVQTSNDIKANKVDPKLKSRKKAASSTKSKVTTKTEEDFNPLAMSDEEFEKISSKYI